LRLTCRAKTAGERNIDKPSEKGYRVECVALNEEPKARRAEACEHKPSFEAIRKKTALRSNHLDSRWLDGGHEEASGVEDGVPRKRQALEADPSGQATLTHVSAYARAYTHTRTVRASCARHTRIMQACARYAGAGHYLINRNKSCTPYLAGISAFLRRFLKQGEIWYARGTF
jgi:hypothetical protein